MGGGHGDHPAYPRRVWTPYGGWWYTPANWKKNTQIGLIGAGIATFCVLIFSSNREVIIFIVVFDSESVSSTLDTIIFYYNNNYQNEIMHNYLLYL